MGKRIMTPGQIDEVCELREAGYSLTRIVKAMAEQGVTISEGAIDWTCRRRGADLPPERRASSPRPQQAYVRNGQLVTPFTPEEDTLIRVLDMQGFGASVIGRRLGRKHNSILGRLATLARHDARAEEAGIAA